MEINIKDQIKNPLLKRTEIHFECLYQGDATPRVLDIKNKLLAILNADKELLVVDKVIQTFGEGKANCYAKIYDSLESLEKIETKHIINKNQELKNEEKPQEEEE
jgi:small subunit ribosomal protein S24e